MDDDRPDPPRDAAELELLTGTLDHARATFRWKCEDLTTEQLRSTPTASNLSLAGVTKHLALAEWSWFRSCLLGDAAHPVFADIDWDTDPDWEFHTAAEDDPDWLFALYEECCAASRAAVASATSLDQVAVRPRRGQAISVRWILVHMIDETARHNGHADIIRESIDGAVGY